MTTPPHRIFLSPRELEVYRHYGLALTSKEIGAELGLSQKTVHVHLANIRNKLGGPNRHQMLRDAVLWVEAEKAQELLGDVTVP